MFFRISVSGVTEARSVFNVEPCDDLTLPETDQPTTTPEIDEDEICESILGDTFEEETETAKDAVMPLRAASEVR